MLRWLAEVLTLTGLCLLTGWLATFTGQPPSLEMAVWPPTGLGLVAVLVRGYRLLPGVFLPHLLFALQFADQYAPTVGPLEVFVGSSLIAGAYTIQAAVGAWLIRAWIGYPTKLCRLREIGLFLFVAGPLAGFITTTITAAVLCELGARPWERFSTIWIALIWGDITGGVMFGVLGLVLMGHPREVWRPRARTIVTPLGIGVLLMSFAYAEAKKRDEAPRDQMLTDEANQVAVMLSAEFQQLVEGLASLEESPGDLRPIPTHRTTPWGQLRFINRMCPAVQATGIGVVTIGGQRVVVEQAMRRRTRGYEFYELDRDSKRVPAPVRLVHAPVLFLEPRGQSIDEGFDLASDSVRGEVYRRALETGRPALSSITLLHESRNGAHGVIVVVPFVPKDATLAPEAHTPTSFAFAAIDLANWVEEARLKSEHKLPCQLVRTESAPRSNPVSGSHVARRRLELAGESWDLRVSASTQQWDGEQARHVMLTGMVGALITLLLAALLLSVTGQTALIAEQVASRTAELEDEVTVRTFTEAVLRTTSERLAVAQQLANLGYWEWNPELDEAYVSPQLADLLGIAGVESNTKGRVLLTHVYPDDLIEFKAAISAALALPQPVPIEFRMVRTDGEVRWVSMTVTGVDTETGRNVHGTLLDVTLQKRARFALEDAEARQRVALAAGGMGTLIWDVGTTRMTCDTRAQTLLGLLLGAKEDGVSAFFTAIHPADRDAVEASFAQVNEMAVPANQSDCECEFRVVHPTGEVRWVHSRGRVIRDDDNEPAQLYSLIFDVTARKEAEEVLRASEARLAESQRIAKLGSWEWQLRTNLMWWSTELFHLLRRPPQSEPIAFDTMIEWMHPDDRERIKEQVDSTLQSGGPVPEFEARFVLPDGEIRWYRAIAQLVSDETGPAWLKGVTQDITEQKFAEEQRRKFEDNLQQTQRLESLGILAGGIAHDFNNLLTGMLGNASLARELISSDSELHEFLRPIEKSAEHAAQLCQQMLAYAGKGATVRGPLDLNELIHESSDLMKLAASRKANLQVEHGADLPLVIGDAGQLRQVLLNLIQNASEALGAEPGSVIVRTRSGKSGPTVSDDMTWSGEPPSGEYVCLEVTDTGCGMSPTTRARIFEPFFTTKFTGRGLGLSAVHGIVKQHNGAMCVSSREGKGTTFGIFLPSALNVVQSGPQDDQATLTDTPLPIKKVALVAEDEPPIRALATVALRALGFAVVEAVNGRVAVELLRENPQQFSLAVLDIVMPELDGREVLTEVRTLRPEMPVVLASGFSEYDLADLLADPNVRYLPKPFRPTDLTSCVRQMLHTSGRCTTVNAP